MIFVNSDLKSFISGVYNGKNYRLPYNEELYKELKELQTKAEACKEPKDFYVIVDLFAAKVESFDFDAQLVSLTDGIVFSHKTGKYHLMIDGNIFDAVHIPDVLADIIKDNVEAKLDSTPIINLCARFLLNPKPTQYRFNMLAAYITQTWTDYAHASKLMEEKGLSEEVAETLSTYPDLQITQEGYLKTSKVVDEITKKWSIKLTADGKPVKDDEGQVVKELVDAYAKSYIIDEETGEVTEEVTYPEFLEDRRFKPAIYSNGDKFYSGAELGYKYQIGKRAWLESWDMVAMEDERMHEKGLHTGGLRYVDGYLRGHRVLLDVFVCPSMIGKFTDQGMGEMTAKEFFIYGSAMLGTNLRGMYHTSTYTSILREELIKDLKVKYESTLKNVDEFKELHKGATAIINKVL